MKKIIFAIFTLFIVTIAKSQGFKTPIDYLNFIGKGSAVISRNTWNYTKAVAHSKSARKIDASRKTLLKSIQNASKKIGGLKNGYRGDTEYRDQFLSYLSISEKYINDEYEKIIDMQEVAEESYDFMEAYIMARDLVNEKINDEVEKLNTNQKLFGKKYNIQITDNNSDLSKKMRASNAVFKYHTEIFLIFFKANVTDINLMKSIEQKDLNAIQQQASSLELYANEGLEKLKTTAPFNKDASLITATKKALEFYKKEAIELTPKVISFLMLNQQLEDTKEALEKKPEKHRTKQEIDNLNNLVKSVNNEISEYNKLNSLFYQNKVAVNMEWEQTGEQFISKHVPKD
ncbi:hypothetical protein [Flavobacterium sp. 28YEA47A]|uniref:LIC11966 family surface protein n=1 Tax=Flavobacterium sp. 28YEA47A TaxID=3156276 RepID=UPI00351480C4